MKNAGKACNNRLYRHIRTFEKIVKNYFVIYIEILPFFAFSAFKTSTLLLRLSSLILTVENMVNIINIIVVNFA